MLKLFVFTFFVVCNAEEASVATSAEQTIENVKITNLNYICTASWDPIVREDGDGYPAAATLYTVYDLKNPVDNCINTTETSCVVSFKQQALPLFLTVEATVAGETEGRSVEKGFYLFELDTTIESPVVNVSREGANVTVILARPSPFSSVHPGQFVVKYFFFANGTKHHPTQITTYNREVVFVTSASKDSRICVEAQILMASTLWQQKSNWTEVCIDGEQESTLPSGQGNERKWQSYYILVGVLVLCIIFFAIVILVCVKKYCCKPLRNVVVELPKDTVKVIEMSQRPDEALGEVEALEWPEKFSRIEKAELRFEKVTLLNESPTEAEGQECSIEETSGLLTPEDLVQSHPSIERSEQMQNSNQVEQPEFQFPKDTAESLSNGIENECGGFLVEIHVAEDVCPDLLKPGDATIKPRKVRLESTDSAFCDGLSASADAGAESPDSQRSESLSGRSRLSVDSSYYVDEGYVRVPSQQ